MNDAAAFVCFETCFFDDIVEPAGIVNLIEDKLGVGFVGRYQPYGADADNTVEQTSVHFQVDDAEHIQIINLSIENASTPLNPVGRYDIAGHFEPEHLQQKNKQNKYDKPNTGNNPVFGNYLCLAVGKF